MESQKKENSVKSLFKHITLQHIWIKSFRVNIIPKNGHKICIFKHRFQPLAQMERQNQYHPWFMLRVRIYHQSPQWVYLGFWSNILSLLLEPVLGIIFIFMSKLNYRRILGSKEENSRMRETKNLSTDAVSSTASKVTFAKKKLFFLRVNFTLFMSRSFQI